MKELFRKFSNKISYASGTAMSFVIALLIIIVWGLTGPMFGFSDTWQLVINTGTTIVTFLMVFLIQNTQNRDSKSLHLKLDELIRSSTHARDSFLGLDDLSDDELSILDDQFKAIHDKLPASDRIHKLHTRIAAEKQRRSSSTSNSLSSAGKAITGLLKTPFSGLGNGNGNDKSKDDKKSDKS